MKGQVNKWQELQLQLEKAKVELNEKEKVLNKSRDELVRTTAQYDQASAKVRDCSWVTEKSPLFMQLFGKRTLHLNYEINDKMDLINKFQAISMPLN